MPLLSCILSSPAQLMIIFAAVSSHDYGKDASYQIPGPRRFVDFYANHKRGKLDDQTTRA
jgi:hypothetical protein